MYWNCLLFAFALGDHEADNVRFARLASWIQKGIEEAELAPMHPPLTESLEIRRGRFGLSLFARKRFEENNIIATIPLSHLVSLHSFSEAEASLGIDDGLALFLASQKRLGMDSRWSPYVDMLPTHHYELPKYWNLSLLDEHLNGSSFPVYVHTVDLQHKKRLEPIALKHNMSTLDLMWARDTVATRAMSGNELGNIMFPIFDLALHGDAGNLNITYDNVQQVLHVVAYKRIHKGEEMLNKGYFIYKKREDGKESTTNWKALHNWGFASDRLSETPGARCSEVFLKYVDAERLQLLAKVRSPVIAPVAKKSTRRFKVNLCDSADDPQNNMFLSLLRQLASNGTSLPTAISYVPASVWGIEARALMMGMTWLAECLRNFPQSLEEDEALLADPTAFTDLRIRFMVMLRRDEKLALNWWLTLFRREIEAVTARTFNAPVDENYLLEKSSKLAGLLGTILAFFKTLVHDATEASDQPLEFCLVVGAIAFIVHLIFLVVCWCRGDRIAFWRLGWLVSLLAYGVNAAMCRWEMVKFTLDHQMTLAVITAITLWLVIVALFRRLV